MTYKGGHQRPPAPPEKTQSGREYKICCCCEKPWIVDLPYCNNGHEFFVDCKLGQQCEVWKWTGEEGKKWTRNEWEKVGGAQVQPPSEPMEGIEMPDVTMEDA
jgi:hypothetical protein